jgi:outer membrane PBP1 activator LpoA protein
MLASFSEALRAEGGQLLDYAAYDTWEQDFSAPITRMLQLDRSEERHQRLAQALGTRLEFQPRRRQDADFIFLAARNAQARLIRPQLRYFFAGNLPTYAPSAVYQPGGGAEGDLNGIIFPDAPWLLDPDEGMQSLKTQIEGFWPGRGDRLGRLYAMGFDAYRLVPLLFEATAGHDSAEIDGMSGRLRLERDGRIHRTLAWAQFRGGRPVAFALPPVEVYQEAETVDMVPAVIGSRQ